MSDSVRAGVFALDGDFLSLGAFAGVTDGRTWNGWSVPLFAFAAVEAMRECCPAFMLSDGSPALVWGGVDGRTLLEASESEGPVEWRTVPAVWSGGVCYWRVGDGWVWGEVNALEVSALDVPIGGAL